MSRRLVLHPGAVRDIREAAQWYDQRSAGLGQLVLAEVRRVMERLRLFPEAYPCLKPGIRQAALARIPYYITYAVTADSVTLIALMHVRRDDHAIQHLIGGRQP